MTSREGYDAYTLYLGIKLHFYSKDYNFVRYNGKVKADINLSDKSWFFLETEKASYRIKEKTLYANNEVIGFYDDGSSFTTPSLEYNFKSGIAESEEGIVMFGKWGIIEADKFSFNSIKDIYKFDDRALMIVK